MALMDRLTTPGRPARRLGCWSKIAKTSQLAFVAIQAVVVLAVSCGGGQGPEVIPPGFPVTVERADGGKLTFDRPPQRIVSLSPGHTEILFTIGVGDRIIAVDSGSDFPSETEGKTKIDLTPLDEETLTGLAPDLVIIMDGPVDAVRSLDELGLPVLWLERPDSLSAVFNQIDVLGEVTDRVDQSDLLIDEMDGRFLAVLVEVGATVGPRVYHELDDDLRTVSPDTFTGEMYLILNATIVTDDAQQSSSQLTIGEIVEADPEVIIVAHRGASPESIKARPGWQGISAVREDRIYAIDPGVVNRPGPRLADGLETLANLLYPDLFPVP